MTTNSNLVIIRSRDAGVYIGEFVSREFNEVVLRNPRNLWSWEGANTLIEVANNGVDMKGSRVSEPLEGEGVFFEVCSLYPVSEKARESLTTSRWF